MRNRVVIGMMAVLILAVCAESGRAEKDAKHAPAANPLLNALDKDHDGKLSKEEIQGAANGLAELDKDKDGVVSPEEFAVKEEKPGLFGEPKALLDLGIWTLLVFFILLFVLGKFAWKPILQGLQTRESTIQDARDEALKASEEAKRYRDELQAELKKANEEASRIIDESRKVAEEQANEKRKAAEQEVDNLRERAKREIEAAKDQALQEIWTQTADLAVAVSSKAIRRELGTEDHRRLVDEALAEIKNATKNGSASA